MTINIAGYDVLIDDEDYERVSMYKWYLIRYFIETHKLVYFSRCFYDENRKRYTMSLHRYIMRLSYHDNLVCDHINGNTLDNRKCNLRICSSLENSRNRKLQINNKTGYKGVYISKASGRYIARIRVNNKGIFLGEHDTPEEAYAAYCEASKKYHGEFGRLK